MNSIGEKVRRRALGVPRWLALHDNMLGVVPVLVYQMGKVGSSSVTAAIGRCWLPVFQVHRMDAGHLQQTRDRRRSLGWYVPPLHARDHLGLEVRRRLIDRGGRAKIVTLVRDPLARNYSSYFENLDWAWHRERAHERASPETLAADFLARFPHEEALTWFDDEMLPVTGIDVYDHPFPDCGYRAITTDRFELLILKTELPDETKSAVIGDFVGRPALAVRPLNVTSRKPAGDAFRAFRSVVRLDPAFVDRMLGSRYATHFYTPAARDRLRSKYVGREVLR